MVRIVTDSTSDISASHAKELDVTVMPLTVHIGAESFRDGVDITPAAFYEKLAQAAELPTTSQINPDRFATVFQEFVDGGDQVVGIFLSSELSGTFQSAHIAQGLVGQGVYVVDSRTVTFALELLVEEACRLRDRGCSATEIAAVITELTDKVRLFAAVDTLKYLKMGGRISAATAMVGGILGISPIISVQHGIVESIGKARGRKAAFTWILNKVKTVTPDLTRGVAFGHTNAPEIMEECMTYFPDLAAAAPYVVTGNIGSVVGTHAGPGAAGLAYFEA